MKLEWRNPWFGGKGWTPCKATTLEEAARELPMPYHEETVLRDAETKKTFRRGGKGTLKRTAKESRNGE